MNHDYLKETARQAPEAIWQNTDRTSGWVFGMPVRGVVRVPLATVCWRGDGWYWKIHDQVPYNRSAPCGSCGLFENALSRVEELLGYDVRFTDYRASQPE